MAMSKGHIHKYMRVNLGIKKEYPVYRCVRPGCTHYQRASLVMGMQGICWRCARPFVLTIKNIQHVKTTCNACSGGTIKTDQIGLKDKADELIRKLGIR